MLWPEKLSEILELALEDFKICEADPKIIIDMHEWYNGCRVCLAGSVIRQRLGSDAVYSTGYLKPNSEDHAHLRALNLLRSGEVSEACEYLGLTTKVQNQNVCDYHVDKDQWHCDIQKLLKDLKEAGE